MTKDITNMLNHVAFKDGLYVGHTFLYLLTSTNGTNWVYRNGPPPPVRMNTFLFGTRNALIVGAFGNFPNWTAASALSDSFVGLNLNPGFPPQLQVSGVNGWAYRIDYIDNLRPDGNNWQELTSFSMSNSPFLWTDPTATNSQRFYRAALSPSP
jgi:hypothetical protein